MNVDIAFILIGTFRKMKKRCPAVGAKNGCSAEKWGCRAMELQRMQIWRCRSGRNHCPHNLVPVPQFCDLRCQVDVESPCGVCGMAVCVLRIAASAVLPELDKSWTRVYPVMR